MDLRVQFMLSHITELNEWQQSMTTNGWFTFYWLDESLKWNISDYGGMDTICMSSEDIWIPDITLLNTANERELMNHQKSPKSSNMPRTSLQTSYLTIYMTLLLTLSSLAVAMSVLILRIHLRKGDVPAVLQKLVTLWKFALRKPPMSAIEPDVHDTEVDDKNEKKCNPVWMDDSLKWNSSDFGGQDNLFLSTDGVWLPDLIVQTVTQRTLFWEQSGLVFVRNSGLVNWTPGDLFSTTCDFDVSYFPFDTQVCNISLTSWYSGANKLRYPFLRIAITLNRRVSCYIYNLIIPITLLSLLSSLVFALPIEHGDKTALSMTVLLAFTVFLSQMTNEMPRTSLQTPYFTVYLTVLLALSSLAVAMSVLVLRLHRRTDEVPLILQRCVTAKKWCSRNKTKKEATSDMTTHSGHNGKWVKSEARVEWKDVSLVLDAFCLRIFMFLNVGCIIALLFILI
ncbi:neuronal acetylcholine receptor subunit beta-3-like [Haliotis asinina]|uniref:neuronal acetylcholine receptor subunit beta-3-like n=1 Tax=Haliotis asinina TaxID=109174 RepID=UPI003532437F